MILMETGKLTGQQKLAFAIELVNEGGSGEKRVTD